MELPTELIKLILVSASSDPENDEFDDAIMAFSNHECYVAKLLYLTCKSFGWIGDLAFPSFRHDIYDVEYVCFIGIDKKRSLEIDFEEKNGEYHPSGYRHNNTKFFFSTFDILQVNSKSYEINYDDKSMMIDELIKYEEICDEFYKLIPTHIKEMMIRMIKTGKIEFLDSHPDDYCKDLFANVEFKNLVSEIEN